MYVLTLDGHVSLYARADATPYLVTREWCVRELEEAAREDIKAARSWGATLSDFLELHKELGTSDDLVDVRRHAAALEACRILDDVLNDDAVRRSDP